MNFHAHSCGFHRMARSILSITYNNYIKGVPTNVHTILADQKRVFLIITSVLLTLNYSAQCPPFQIGIPFNYNIFFYKMQITLPTNAQGYFKAQKIPSQGKPQ